MRRDFNEIKDFEKIASLLESVHIGRLATVGADGFPYITPVNFVFHKGRVYFHCAAEGEKLDNIARNPKVCFEVDVPLAYLDSGYCGGSVSSLHQFYHCVILRGEARVLPDGPEKVEALDALVTKHERGASVEKVREDMPAYKACKVVEITPFRITAKSDLAQNKPEEQRLDIARYLKARNAHKDLETIEAMGFHPADL